ncbi:KAP family P-loop NTPase fold protein [Acinetobacter sp. NigerLNRRAM0016]
MTDQTQLNWNRTNLDNIQTAWEGDLWDRERLGNQLTNYVDRLNCGAVLALDARWGEGKTWFVRHWQKHLEDENHDVIYLDAFANDYLDDPFLTIASEISQAFKDSDEISSEDVKEFNSTTASVLISLASILPLIVAKAGLHWIGLGGAGEAIQEVYKEGKDFYDSASEEITAKVKEQIEKKIENHQVEKETVRDFKDELAKLAEKLEKPLVFIIDELDRCRPDFAIRLIERIKHFFDISKIVFVLVIDKTQFSKVICHNYGYDEKLGEEYLDKFVDFMIPLPRISVPLFNNKFDHVEILKELLFKVGEESDDICLVFYLAQFNNYFSARQLQKVINQYALLRKPLIETNIFLVLALLLDPTKLTEKIIKTLNVLEGISKQQDMSSYVTDLKRLDLEQLQSLVKDQLKLDAKVYFDLMRKIKEIEMKNLHHQKHDQEFVRLYSEFSLQKIIKNQNEISNQFELYLKAHLWDKNDET